MKNRIVFRVALHAALVAVMFCSVALSSSRNPPTYVKGSVILAKRPLRSAWVIASQAGQEKGKSLTGDDGKYYIGNLENGVYDLVVMNGKKQIYSGQVTLPVPGGNFNISVP